MTATHIALVRTSFELVRPILEPAAVMFYDRLFELDPSLRSLFRNSREAQAQKLAQALTVVVKGLEQPAQLRGAVEALGRRHAGYGVRDEHYTTVGEALIWTLEQGLGEAFTPEVRNAWIDAYGWLAFVMREAAASATQAA
ncbi:MAG TPA: globin family protein [Vicinamibacterales bacterium]|jgi:hemoglobin-like flavoprotein|nr:globin family protein [Vicinamibacterales bacterium]